jgi:hypothetical protein
VWPGSVPLSEKGDLLRPCHLGCLLKWGGSLGLLCLLGEGRLTDALSPRRRPTGTNRHEQGVWGQGAKRDRSSASSS